MQRKQILEREKKKNWNYWLKGLSYSKVFIFDVSKFLKISKSRSPQSRTFLRIQNLKKKYKTDRHDWY